MLNCISKENLLYVKASNIFVGFEFRGNSSVAHMQLFLTMEDKL